MVVHVGGGGGGREEALQVLKRTADASEVRRVGATPNGNMTEARSASPSRLPQTIVAREGSETATS